VAALVDHQWVAAVRLSVTVRWVGFGFLKQPKSRLSDCCFEPFFALQREF
jgi:hypothetical protein